MSFLFPAFLLGALAAAIPILLHLSRRDRVPHVKFSDIRFLRQASPMQARRRRLKELLLLALRVGALVLLALAFARPFIGAGLIGRAVAVVALDTSYSMADPARFAAAQAAARAAIAEIPASHEVGVITFDDRALVASRPSLDHGLAVAAVDRATAGFGATRYDVAIDEAVRVIAPREGRILIVTDLQRVGWDGSRETTLPPDVVVTTLDVGAADENLAVASVEMTPEGMVGVVANTGPDARTTSVRLQLDGVEVAAREATLAPGSSEVAFNVELPREGVVVLEVEDPSGLAADNRRYRLLGPTMVIPVVVVAERGASDPFYVTKGLTVGGAARLLNDRAVSPRELSATELADAAVVLVLGADLDRRARDHLRDFLAQGGGLLLAGGPALGPEAVSDLLGIDTAPPDGAPADPSTRGWSVTDVRHPIFRIFRDDLPALGYVRFSQVVAMGLVGGRRLASFSDGSPALIEYAVGRGRAIVFASDLGNQWNDFPRRSTFVPFLHEVIRYLSGQREQLGHLLVADAPRGVAPEPGVHTVPTTTRRVVLNVDPRESNVRRMTAEAFRRQIAVRETTVADAEASFGEVPGRDGEQELWWYAMVALIAVLGVEAWLARTAA